MSEIAGMIAKLERATGSDRELDQLIAELCAPTDDPRMAAFESGDDYPRNYTKSIDAALSLVPEGHFYVMARGKMKPTEPLYGAQVLRPTIGLDPPEALGEGEHDHSQAIAIVLAALRARESTP